MKVEMGESLCYSYLRHVKRCWLVQTNWKSSEHWTTYKSSDDLEAMFRDMREKFDKDGRVFKQTRTATQFMKQGEVDVVGVDPEGGVHALDVAFHEGGLLYGGGTDNRILKKLLRTYMLLLAYRPAETRFHIYFAAPKVHVGPQKELERTFSALRTQYREADWLKITNLALLRRTGLGREVNGHDRYWAKRYGEFYVCSEWWKDDHVENASKLLEFVQGIAGRDPDHPGVPALEAHMRTLGDYAQ